MDSGSTYNDQADVLIQATGALNNWTWPNIPGLHDFKGKLLHSASWDEDYDYSVCSAFIAQNNCF
jgi:cation diffusion facilitator CzcD-associated flavoprotein CzcO